jgi:hypothetical protein
MRRHVTYANVAATLALVFAMSGGALAAKHYLIESTNQINPKVVKKLRGTRGKTGVTGATGKTGAPGAPGATGAPGAAGAPGKDGANATSLFAVVEASGTLARGSGVVESTKSGVGSYIVKFKQNVTKCAFVASVGEPDFEGEAKGVADAQGAFTTTDSVFVETHAIGSETAASKPFHLVVLC